MRWGEKVGRTPAREKRLERKALLHTSPVTLDHFSDTHPKRKFPTAWIFDTSTDAKQFRSKVPTAAKRLIPLNAMSQNARKVTERFDIVNDSGFAPKATDLRKRRFRTGISALAFKRVKQSGLFASDVATRAGVNHYIEIESCAKYVAP